MTMRESSWRCPPADVLAAVDFGEASTRAVALAGLIASAFDARFRALHAERFEPPPYFTLEQIERLEAARREAEAGAAEHLRRFVAATTAYPVEPLVRNDSPVDAILHEATTADLIVIGTHGRIGPRRWWLGSVAERVVRAATVPVLVTRASGGSVLDSFGHLILFGDGASPGEKARRCVDTLAATFGGTVSFGGQLSSCTSGVPADASIVAIATARNRSSWGIADAVAQLLGACERPVLFVPAS